MKTKNFKKIGMYGLGAIAIVSLVGLDILYAVEMNSEENVISVLNDKGFKDVEITGHAWLCPKGSYIRKTFEATNSNGDTVEGKICDGALLNFYNSVSTEVIAPKKIKCNLNKKVLAIEKGIVV